MIVEVQEDAQGDLISGYQFYERQAETLGEYFLQALTADLKSLELSAGIHPLHFGYHRLLAKHFPFAIYYRVVGSSVRVSAILDCRRDPAHIRKRLTATPDVILTLLASGLLWRLT